MQSLKFKNPSLLNHLYSNSARSFLSRYSALSLPPKASKESISMINYLNANIKFSKSLLNYFSNQITRGCFPRKPLSVMKFFQQLGFSQSQIHFMIRQKPQILFSDIDKTLRPKIEFFQSVGFEDPELCKFISNHPTILSASLNKTLIPSVEAIRKFGYSKKYFIRVLNNSGRLLPKYKKFLGNLAFLEGQGVPGSQISLLLKRQSWLFAASESYFRNCVSRAVDMGFRENSAMFVHALHTISSLSDKTFKRKQELIQCCGFSKDETLQMFRKAPTLLRTSEKKLMVGIEFFLHTVMLPKSALVQQPAVLMFCMEDRVIPRYRVMQLIKSKNLCEKDPSFTSILRLTEEMFLKKYLLQFRENAEALLAAYKGHHLEVEAASK